MRTAVLSDVHANIEALDAVLRHARADRIVVLGDLVGYNADPEAVLERLGDAGAFLLAGNHDLATSGRFDVSWFNDVAAEAIAWTRERLGDRSLAHLAELEPRSRDGDRLFVHGSARDPVAEYLRDSTLAAASFDAEEFWVGYFGHTHLPVAYIRRGAGVSERVPTDDDMLLFDPGARYLLNPGSVGQPRDGDPRASYLVVDDATVRWHRVAYDVERTQRKVRAAGLPEVLAARLGVGR